MKNKNIFKLSIFSLLVLSLLLLPYHLVFATQVIDEPETSKTLISLQGATITFTDRIDLVNLEEFVDNNQEIFTYVGYEYGATYCLYFNYNCNIDDSPSSILLFDFDFYSETYSLGLCDVPDFDYSLCFWINTVGYTYSPLVLSNLQPNELTPDGLLENQAFIDFILDVCDVDGGVYELDIDEPENIKYTPCLTFSSDNTFTLNVVSNTKFWDGVIEYSMDRITWNEWTGTTAISSNSEGKLYMRGIGNTYITGSGSSATKGPWRLNGMNISAIGNIETLLDYETVANGEHPTMAPYCFRYLFKDSTALITAPELPAVILSDNCYSNMFDGCSSLTTLVELPATTLTPNCYYYMFKGCTNIKISETESDVYTNAYRIPVDGTGTTSSYSTYNMFLSTGGSFKSSPNVDTIYYTSNRIVTPCSHTEAIIESVQPTCTETGLTEGKYCSDCYVTLVAQEVIPALGHVEVIDEVVNSTCTENGYTAYYCSRCSFEWKNYEEMLSHNLYIYEIITATCLAEGYTINKCRNCDFTLNSDSTGIGDHLLVADSVVEPTCTEKGYTINHCEHCLIQINTSYVEELPHTEAIIEAVESTCTETGLTEGKYCSVCNEILLEQEVTELKEHNYLLGKCQICDDLDPNYNFNEVNSNNHSNFKEWLDEQPLFVVIIGCCVITVVLLIVFKRKY